MSTQEVYFCSRDCQQRRSCTCEVHIVNTKVKHRATEPLRNLLKLNTFSTSHFSSTFSELYIVSIVLCAADEAGVVTRAAGQKRPRLSLSEDFKSLISTTVWLFILLWNVDIIKTKFASERDLMNISVKVSTTKIYTIFADSYTG